ncbi:MAG: hypothetical protein ACXADY_07090 [Candidatus Hodarchaeales archaeon]
MDIWEISFNLRAGDRSEQFQFLVNPVKDMTKTFPSFPKDKFLRALQSHSEDHKYALHSGMINNLKIRHTSEIHENQEIHVIMLVMENIGPISLIFRQTFEYLTFEGIDSNYNYIGSDALLNVLLQIIKPDSPAVKGLGKITTIYHASNIVELTRKESFVSLLDSQEGQMIVFGLSIIFPTIVIIVLPIEFLDSMLGYIISLGVLSILWCIFPIAKRSTRYAPLAVVSALASYIIIETSIHLNFLIGGINPWGIFNNISRQNLVGILQNQDLISELGYEVFLGIELLQVIIPFLDSIFIILIPFSVGVGLSGLFMISERKWKSATVLRTFFAVLFLISIIIIPLGYHTLGKGSEGTLHAGIGLVETAEMFSPRYIENFDEFYLELKQLIASAQEHLAKAGNSFEQFGENPLIAYILPYLMPEVGGIPLEDLPEILTLTGVLAETLPYFSNILWGYYNLQTGFNQTFDILQQSIEKTPQGGLGAKIFQEYDIAMLEALGIMQQGVDNLTFVENPILNLISEVKEKFDYSVFAEMSNLLSELEIGLPLIITVVSGAASWINSTYKLILVLDELNNFNFDSESETLTEAEKDYNDSLIMQEVETESLPEGSLIPFGDLINFSLNLNQVTKYFLYSVQNATSMFQALNNTLYQIQGIDFSNSSNIQDHARWDNVDQGINDTSTYLISTQTSLDNMSTIMESQTSLEFEELAGLNRLLEDLEGFTQSASERVDIVDQYVSALNGTLRSIRFFSLGSYSLNETLTAAIGGGSFEPNNATINFNLSQVAANKTYENLTAVRGELLNESAVDNWQLLVKGNITNNETNSIYMNAQRCLNLIADIEALRITPLEAETEFQKILDKMEELDANWNIFT